MNAPLLMSAEDVAANIGCCKRLVWKMTKEGKLPQPVKLGGLTRWRTADIQEHIGAL